MEFTWGGFGEGYEVITTKILETRYHSVLNEAFRDLSELPQFSGREVWGDKAAVVESATFQDGEGRQVL
jgi:hypothetical protein